MGVATLSFLDAIKSRRSHYALNKILPPQLSQCKITDLVNQTVIHCPSAFNSQSTRVLVLYGTEHEKLWEMTKEILKPFVPAEAFPTSDKKLSGFHAAYGTVLFFEDPNTVHALQQNFPLYADKFPEWSEHTSGMHQYILWTALTAEGLGCNLQHYNPVIDRHVCNEWGVDHTWSLKGQLVFGGICGQAKRKVYEPLEKRVLIKGAEHN